MEKPGLYFQQTVCYQRLNMIDKKRFYFVMFQTKYDSDRNLAF
jgi:hypothetical protein